MANTYDLTQTGSEVQAILNDANNIKGAGAQTTLTTDYILLKDTNGQYHKILKDSFTEACRNVLAGLLVNNDKGTTISQIAAVASGDFGSITPANLASVLGDRGTIDMNGKSFGELGYGTYNFIAGRSATDAPSAFVDQYSQGIVVTFRSVYSQQSKPRVGQIIFATMFKSPDTPGLFWRMQTEPGEWKPWYDITGTLLT